MAFERGVLSVWDADTGKVVSASRPLTDGEKAALQAEVTNNAVYRAGGQLLDADTLDNLINGTYVTANPPQTRVARTSCTRQEFVQFMIGVQFAALEKGGDIDAKYALIQSRLMPYIEAQDTIDLTSSILAPLLAGMVTDGVLSAQDEQTFGTQLDPNWKPETVNPARSSVIFDVPLTLEATDWEGIS